MPMVFGFSRQRQQLLEAEFLRIAGEMRQLGTERFWLSGDLARGRVGPESELELVIVREMAEPFHRRSDFFQTHLRPRVGTRFAVYTPAEFEELEDQDLVIRQAVTLGDPVYV